MEKVLAFLKQLNQNNNREWFTENKASYLEVKKEVEDFTAAWLKELAPFDPSIAHLQPKNCLYRIYRDVRFSKDKSPYKNHIGIFVCKGGTKSNFGGYYLHLQPGNCLFFGGTYELPSEDLKKVRLGIYYNMEEFKKIVNTIVSQKNFTGIWEEGKLKTSPKGFPKDLPDIDFLRYKYYSLQSTLSEKEIASPTLIQKVVNLSREVQPFNNFLNNTLTF